MKKSFWIGIAAMLVFVVCLCFAAKSASTETKVRYIPVHGPDKFVYQVGEPFEIAGYEVTKITNVDGNETSEAIDNYECYFVASGVVKITDGYVFKQTGTKKLDCYYQGKKLPFKLNVYVVDYSDGTRLKPGKYTIGVLGNYFSVDKNKDFPGIQLNDKKKKRLKFEVSDIGWGYYVKDTKTDLYLACYSNKDDNCIQLTLSTTPFGWKISNYPKSGFTTMRPDDNKKLLVIASGGKDDNGTKVSAITSKGSAPKKGKLHFKKI